MPSCDAVIQVHHRHNAELVDRDLILSPSMRNEDTVHHIKQQPVGRLQPSVEERLEQVGIFLSFLTRVRHLIVEVL